MQERTRVIVECWAHARHRWLHLVMVELSGKDVDRSSSDFAVQEMLSASAMKAVQLNEGLSFARKYVPEQSFQPFADELIAAVTTAGDREEVIAYCTSYLKKADQQQAYFGFSSDIASQLTGLPYCLRESLLIQNRVLLLLGFTYQAVAGAFEDAETLSDLQRKLDNCA